MAEFIVDGFEAIEVETQQGERDPFAPQTKDRVAEPIKGREPDWPSRSVDP
jgi:hypothetical protein